VVIEHQIRVLRTNHPLLNAIRALLQSIAYANCAALRSVYVEDAEISSCASRSRSSLSVRPTCVLSVWRLLVRLEQDRGRLRKSSRVTRSASEVTRGASGSDSASFSGPTSSRFQDPLPRQTFPLRRSLLRRRSLGIICLNSLQPNRKKSKELVRTHGKTRNERNESRLHKQMRCSDYTRERYAGMVLYFCLLIVDCVG